MLTLSIITIQFPVFGDENSNSILKELIPNHNKLNTDRINLIFASRYEVKSESDYYLGSIRKLIGWDGPNITIADNPDKNLKLNYGFFATDPIREYKDKFNIWYTDNKDEIYSLKINRKVLMLSDFSVKNGGHGYGSSNERIDKNPNTFREATSGDSFGVNTQANNAFTLSHELGHVLFGFDEEYLKYKGDTPDEDKLEPTPEIEERIKKDIPNFQKANCALTEGDANKKWGDLSGDVDSFYDEINNDLNNLGIKKPQGEFSRDDFKIGNIPFRCAFLWEVSSGRYIYNFKATQNSIMNSYINKSNFNNIWGSSNKRIIIEILNNIKGTGNKIAYDKNSLNKVNLEKVKNSTLYDLDFKEKEELGIKTKYRITLDPNIRSINNYNFPFTDRYIVNNKVVDGRVINYPTYVIVVLVVVFVVYKIRKIYKTKNLKK